MISKRFITYTFCLPKTAWCQKSNNSWLVKWNDCLISAFQSVWDLRAYNAAIELDRMKTKYKTIEEVRNGRMERMLMEQLMAEEAKEKDSVEQPQKMMITKQDNKQAILIQWIKLRYIFAIFRKAEENWNLPLFSIQEEVEEYKKLKNKKPAKLWNNEQVNDICFGLRETSIVNPKICWASCRKFVMQLKYTGWFKLVSFN